MNKYCNEQCIGWFMNDWWTPLCIMTRRHHILGISWTNRRVSNFKILQPLSSWHRGTSCLWVQVMPFLHPGSLLWGQVKVLTLEKNLGRATRPGDEPVPGKKTKRRERNWVIVEAGPRLDYQLQITPPPEITLFSGRWAEPEPKLHCLLSIWLGTTKPWFEVFKMYTKK